MEKNKEGLVHYQSPNRSGKTYEQAMRLAEMAQKFTSVKIEVKPWEDINELKSLRKEITALRKIAEAAEKININLNHNSAVRALDDIQDALKEWREGKDVSDE